MHDPLKIKMTEAKALSLLPGEDFDFAAGFISVVAVAKLTTAELAALVDSVSKIQHSRRPS